MTRRVVVSIGCFVLVFGSLIVAARSDGQQQSERSRCERNCTEQHEACMRAANANSDVCTAAMQTCLEACKSPSPSPTPTGSPAGSPSSSPSPDVSPSPEVSPSPTPQVN